MNRRMFLTGSLAMTATVALPGMARAAQATPDASAAVTRLPELRLSLTDTGFEIDQPLKAGRYRVIVTNTGTSAESHFALGRIPDSVTDAQYEEWLSSETGETEALRFEDIGFVGVPDWPQPSKPVSGVVDIAPGRYFLFDPISGRQPLTVMVEGELTASAEPASDFTVVLHEMAIDLPDAALTTEPVRWKIENTGAMSHEVAVIPVSPDFTDAHLQLLFSLPEDATPPADVPAFVYQPAAAIGILAPQHTSWLDVQLAPGRYLAACMLPFSTGYPHAMDGMYRFIDVK
jgi:hypothetical protein